MTDVAPADAWNGALDALESLMQRQREFIDGLAPMPDSPWIPPEDELPATLRVRALSLAAACAEIETQLHELLQARTDRAASPYR